MYVYDCIDFESGDETMNITNSNQSMGFMPVSQSTQDSHEQNIQKQIINLQEKMRDITYNNEMSSEEKNDTKKAAKKQREEAEKTEESAAKESAAADTETDSSEEIVLFPESDASKSMLSNANMKEHLSNLQKIRTDLEGKLRTAESEEEKARLRKRLSSVSKGMGFKVQKIKDTIADAPSDVQTQKSGRPQQESKADSSVQGKVLITRKKY